MKTTFTPPGASPNWVIEIDAIGPCYLNEDIEGDPGRTAIIGQAWKFHTEKDARDNLRAIQRKYPNRIFRAAPVPA